MGSSEHEEKPRKLEDETVNYLMQIEEQFSLLDSNTVDSRAEIEENKNILVENVFLELKLRTASTLCDRRTNFLMEKLCFATNLSNLLEVLRRCSAYSIFLMRNRYSSHVLQAIASRLCYILKYEGLSGDEIEEMSNTIIAFVSPMLQELAWLSREISASHVIRSFISLLVGIPTISEKKGKNSKHQHSVNLAEPLDALLLDTGKFYISKSVSFTVPAQFHDLLLESCEALLQLESRELQLLIAESSGCAVLALLIRVLSNPDLIHTESSSKIPHHLAQQMFQLALESDVGDSESQITEQAAKVFYEMAGDTSGSYFLESLIECCNTEFLLRVLPATIQGSANEYATEQSGNFVLQAVLRRLSTELAISGTNNGGSKADTANAKAIFTISKAILAELTVGEVFDQLVRSRGGVVLWLLELCHALPVEDDADSNSWSERVGTGLMDVWIKDFAGKKESDGGEDSSSSSGYGGDSGTTKDDERATAMSAVVKKLFTTDTINPDLSTGNDDDRMNKDEKGDSKKGGGKGKKKPPSFNFAQLLHAKLFGALLKSRSGAVSSVTSRGLALAGSDSLFFIATNGQISKLIIDVFFAGFANTSEFKAVGAQLATHADALARHFVGQHVLRKSFERSDLRGKEKWVMTLTAMKDALISSKEGRASLKTVNAEQYAHDPNEWRSMIKKQIKAASMFKELDVPTSSGTKQSASNVSKKAQKDKMKVGHQPEMKVAESRTTSETGTKEEEGREGEKEGEGGDEPLLNKSGRKRKRKRSGKGTGEKEDEKGKE